MNTASEFGVIAWQLFTAIALIITLGSAALLCVLHANKARNGATLGFIEWNIGLSLSTIFCGGVTLLMWLETPIVS